MFGSLHTVCSVYNSDWHTDPLCLTLSTVPQDAIRLAGGSGPHEGRVEIFHDNVWGTVCDDGWGLEDAVVVCRQLGYPSAVGAFLFAHFGQGSGPIWLDEVGCIGTETNLTQCDHDGFGIEDCIHFEDAGVRCATEGMYGSTNYTICLFSLVFFIYFALLLSLSCTLLQVFHSMHDSLLAAGN